MNSPKKITVEDIRALVVAEEYHLHDRTTVCILKTASGFVVVADTTAADEREFNEEKGRQYALDLAIEKLWPLEVYAQGRMARPYDLVKQQVQADPDTAWSWHANIAMPILDALDVSHYKANMAAERLMRHLFDVDIWAMFPDRKPVEPAPNLRAGIAGFLLDRLGTIKVGQEQAAADIEETQAALAKLAGSTRPEPKEEKMTPEDAAHFAAWRASRPHLYADMKADQEDEAAAKEVKEAPGPISISADRSVVTAADGRVVAHTGPFLVGDIVKHEVAVGYEFEVLEVKTEKPDLHIRRLDVGLVGYVCSEDCKLVRRPSLEMFNDGFGPNILTTRIVDTREVKQTAPGAVEDHCTDQMEIRGPDPSFYEGSTEPPVLNKGVRPDPSRRSVRRMLNAWIAQKVADVGLGVPSPAEVNATRDEPGEAGIYSSTTPEGIKTVFVDEKGTRTEHRAPGRPGWGAEQVEKKAMHQMQTKGRHNWLTGIITPNRIAPTIGRRVWYYPDETSRFQMDMLSDTMHIDAGIVYVHPDGTVNLATTDHGGRPGFVACVRLLNPDDPPCLESHARWMPYQAGQAK